MWDCGMHICNIIVGRTTLVYTGRRCYPCTIVSIVTCELRALLGGEGIVGACVPVEADPVEGAGLL